MRSLVLLLLLGALMLLQLPLFAWMGVRPSVLDLPLAATLFLAATSRATPGFVAAVILGLMADAFTPGGLLGMNAEIHGILFLMLLGLGTRFPLARPVPLVLITLVSSVLKTLLFYVFSLLFDRAFEARAAVLLWGLPTALVTSLLCPVLVLPFAGVDRLIGGRRANESLLR
jgi:rod shape-determining protein MreD